MHEKETDIASIVSQEQTARKALTSKWLELWGMYKTKPIKTASDSGWESKLNDGKVFELVETVSAYIRNALFYSDRWAQLEATEPFLAEIVPLVSTYFVDCLNASNLKREFRVFLTQLLLTGFSGILPYWDEENDCLSFEAINNYDLHIESSQRYDERYSYSFRTVQLNYAKFYDWCESGLLEVDDIDEAWEHYKGVDNIREAELYNLRDMPPLPDKDCIVVTEYYCPKEKELYRLVGEDCLYEASVDECPWLVGLLFETPEEAYPLSILDSSIGLVLANNILHNYRLDNLALAVHSMWLMIDDGVINPSDIKCEPGKVIVAGRPDALTPLRPPTDNFNITYGEAQVIDAKIDRNIGTGAMISANAYRTGERVTASEIESVKDAGGNRLNDLYEHIEAVVVIPLLKRALKLIKENTRKPKVVKQASREGAVYDYFRISPKDLHKDYSIKVTGTQSVINRDRNVSLLTEFITLVASLPQFQELVDWTNIYTDLLVKFGFDDPSRYMVKPKSPEEAPEAAPVPQAPMDAMAAQAQEIGGDPMAQALAGKVAGGQLPELAMNFAGIDPAVQGSVDDTTMQQMESTLTAPPLPM